MSRERREEDAARRVVEAVEAGVRLVSRDVAGAPPGTHDFDVVRGSEVVGALEVTMLLEEDRQRLHAWVSRHGVHEKSGLTQNWYVALDDAAIGTPKSRKTIEELVDALGDLEARGLSHFERRPWVHPDAVLMPIERLPVVMAIASPSDDDAYVSVIPPSEGGAAWAGNAHDALQDALTGTRLVGERGKLARAEGVEKHLFVWADGLFSANIGMTLTDAPYDASPSLPEDVTTVWLAATGGGRVIVWRSTGGPWQRYTVQSDDDGTLGRSVSLT